MLGAFGDMVEFVFRPEGQGHGSGHANSLNLLLNMAVARGAKYFLYLEDDWSLVEWWFVSPGLRNLNAPAPAIVSALAILKAANSNSGSTDSTEPLAQVHLNSQAAKLCAYVDRNQLSDIACRGWIAGDECGWPRRVEFFDASYDPAWSSRHEYRLHEWGLPSKR